MDTLPLSPDELLTTTRAVRKRLDLTRAVPLDLIREYLTIALQAPPGPNRQHWEWVVVTDPEAAEILELPDNVSQGALVPVAYYTGETFRRAPREPLDNVLHVDRW